MKIFVLLSLIFLISCDPHKGDSSQLRKIITHHKLYMQKHDSLQKQKLNKKNGDRQSYSKNKVSQLKIIPSVKIKDVCTNSKAILFEMQAFVNDSKPLNAEKLLYLFSQNEQIDSECYFPNNPTESKIMYRFIDELYKKSHRDYQIVSFIVSLDVITVKNVEVGEYLTFDLLPLIALNETGIFLEVLNLLKQKDKKNLLENLIFSNKDDKARFLKQVNSFNNNPKLQKIIRQINNIRL